MVSIGVTKIAGDILLPFYEQYPLKVKNEDVIIWRANYSITISNGLKSSQSQPLRENLRSGNSRNNPQKWLQTIMDGMKSCNL